MVTVVWAIATSADSIAAKDRQTAPKVIENRKRLFNMGKDLLLIANDRTVSFLGVICLITGFAQRNILVYENFIP